MERMRRIRLHQFTDSHLYADASGAMRGQPTLPSLLSAVSHAGRYAAPDAILLTGDLVHDEPDGYRHLVTVFGHSPVPVHALPGNHDDPVALATCLAQVPFQLGSAAFYGAWQVLFLSTHVPDRAEGTLGTAGLQSLEAQLQQQARPYTLIVMHHHPVPVGSAWIDALGLTDAAAFWQLVDRYPQVRAVLWGHVHQAFDGARPSPSHTTGGNGPAAVRLLGTPSTTVQFLPGSAEFAVDTRGPAWRWLELQADGTLESGVEWVE